MKEPNWNNIDKDICPQRHCLRQLISNNVSQQSDYWLAE